MTTAPTPLDRMSRGTLIAYLQRRLGAGGRRVELSEQELDDCIFDALEMWSEAVGRFVHWQLQGSSAVKRYPLDDMQLPENVTHDEIHAIVNVQDIRLWSEGIYTGNVEAIFNIQPIDTYLSEYIVARNHASMRRDITSCGLEWRWEPGERVLFVDNLYEGMTLGITGVMAFKLEDLPRYHHRRFRYTVEAFGRLRLGDARGKFGGNIPGSQTGITIDSDFQRRRGEEMLRDMATWLEQAKQIAPPILG